MGFFANPAGLPSGTFGFSLQTARPADLSAFRYKQNASLNDARPKD